MTVNFVKVSRFPSRPDPALPGAAAAAAMDYTLPVFVKRPGMRGRALRKRPWALNVAAQDELVPLTARSAPAAPDPVATLYTPMKPRLRCVGAPRCVPAGTVWLHLTTCARRFTKLHSVNATPERTPIVPASARRVVDCDRDLEEYLLTRYSLAALAFPPSSSTPSVDARPEVEAEEVQPAACSGARTSAAYLVTADTRAIADQLASSLLPPMECVREWVSEYHRDRAAFWSKGDLLHVPCCLHVPRRVCVGPCARIAALFGELRLRHVLSAADGLPQPNGFVSSLACVLVYAAVMDAEGSPESVPLKAAADEIFQCVRVCLAVTRCPSRG